MKSRGLKAFTLLEILIAVSIFAMVLGAIYASWSAVLRASQAGLDAAAEAQRTRVALNSIETALTSVQMFAANIRHYSFVADTSGDFAALSFVSNLPESFPGSGMFGDQTLRRVTFNVEPGQDAQNQLMMYQSRMLYDEEPHAIALAKNVKLFVLEFWDLRKGEWATEWLFTNQLPKMVRFSLAFATENSKRPAQPQDVVTRVVSLPALAVPPAFQSPAIPVGGITPGRQPPPVQRPGR
jgi:type II secretion system protein J